MEFIQRLILANFQFRNVETTRMLRFGWCLINIKALINLSRVEVGEIDSRMNHALKYVSDVNETSRRCIFFFLSFFHQKLKLIKKKYELRQIT